MNNENKELPPIEDKIQQIFKFLEIADVSQWQGMNVFEASDADSLYGALKTAFEQVAEDAYQHGRSDEALNCNAQIQALNEAAKEILK